MVRDTRRAVLRVVGSAGLAGLAGCLGGGDGSGSGGGDGGGGGGTTGGGSWPMHLADAGNTGHVPGTSGPSVGVTTKWKRSVEGGGLSAPRVGNGAVYLAQQDSEGGRLHAVDAGSGDRRWRQELPGRIGDGLDEVHLGPVVTGGAVFVSTALDSGLGFYAVDAASGTEQWKTTLGGVGDPVAERVRGPQAVVDGTLYVAHLGIQDTSADPEVTGRVHALNVGDGSEQWATEVERPLSLAVADGEVFVVSNDRDRKADQNDHRIVVLNADDGSRRTTFGVPLAVVDEPVTVADGTLYLPEAVDPNVLALDAETGERQWRTTLEDEEATSDPFSPTVANGSVYVGTTRGGMHALDAASGDQQWRRTETEGLSVGTGSAPVAVDGTVYVIGEGGPLWGLDAERGDTLLRYSPSGMAHGPVVAGGVVYQIAGGELHALVAESGAGTYTTTVEAPPADFEFRCSDGALEVLMVGGDSFTGENTRALRVTAGGETVAEFELPVMAGDRVQASGVEPGTTVRVVYEASGGGTAVVAKYDHKSAC